MDGTSICPRKTPRMNGPRATDIRQSLSLARTSQAACGIANHKFGWYLEPSYEYKFGPSHEHSLGVSGGLLISIP
jgi:hypothetical protein